MYVVRSLLFIRSPLQVQANVTMRIDIRTYGIPNAAAPPIAGASLAANRSRSHYHYSCSNVVPNAPGGVPRNDCQILRDIGEPLKKRSIASLLTTSSAMIINANGAVWNTCVGMSGNQLCEKLPTDCKPPKKYWL